MQGLGRIVGGEEETKTICNSDLKKLIVLEGNKTYGGDHNTRWKSCAQRRPWQGFRAQGPAFAGSLQSYLRGCSSGPPLSCSEHHLMAGSLGDGYGPGLF